MRYELPTRTVRAALLALALMTPALGCHAPSEPDPGVLLTVSGTSFSRAPDGGPATVPFTAINARAGTAYLPRCASLVIPAVQRWEGDRWTEYAAGVCPGVVAAILSPLRLTLAERYDGTVAISEPGRYRLRTAVMRSMSEVSDGRGVVVASNDFTVR